MRRRIESWSVSTRNLRPIDRQPRAVMGVRPSAGRIIRPWGGGDDDWGGGCGVSSSARGMHRRERAFHDRTTQADSRLQDGSRGACLLGESRLKRPCRLEQGQADTLPQPQAVDQGNLTQVAGRSARTDQDGGQQAGRSLPVADQGLVVREGRRCLIRGSDTAHEIAGPQAVSSGATRRASAIDARRFAAHVQVSRNYLESTRGALTWPQTELGSCRRPPRAASMRRCIATCPPGRGPGGEFRFRSAQRFWASNCRIRRGSTGRGGRTRNGAPATAIRWPGKRPAGRPERSTWRRKRSCSPVWTRHRPATRRPPAGRSSISTRSGRRYPAAPGQRASR